MALQNGLAEAPVNKSRKQIKERKNRTKKIRGVKKNAGMCPLPAALAFHYIYHPHGDADDLFERMSQVLLGL